MHDPEEPDQNESPPGLTRRDFLSHAGYGASRTRINGTTYKVRIDRVPRCSTRGACTVHASRLVALFAI